MKKNKLRRINLIALFAMFLVPFLFVQCTKPTTLGGDLVSSEETNFFTTDTFGLSVKTIRSTDSLFAFIYGTSSIGLEAYYLGDMLDPVFGEAQSEIIAQYGPTPGDYAGNFDGATVDSVVLTLVFDSAKFYGNMDIMQSIEVLRLKEAMPIDTSYYTNRDFETEATPLGYVDNFIPNLNKRLLVVTADSTVKDSSLVYVRIPLTNSLGAEILALDSIVFTTAEGFAEKFKGVKIKTKSQTTAMMALNLKSYFSEIDIYYKKPEKDSLVFRIHSFNGYAATNHQTKDYTGSTVESYLDQTNSDLFFMQSNIGLNLEVTLPDLASLGGVIVNKAVLEFTLENIMADDTMAFRPIELFTLTDTSGIGIGGIYVQGGQQSVTATLKRVEKGGVIRQVVQLNISSLMQKIQRGDKSRKIIVKPRRPAVMGRVVLQGFAGEESAQPKLYLNYTEL